MYLCHVCCLLNLLFGEPLRKGALLPRPSSVSQGIIKLAQTSHDVMVACFVCVCRRLYSATVCSGSLESCESQSGCVYLHSEDIVFLLLRVLDEPEASLVDRSCATQVQNNGIRNVSTFNSCERLRQEGHLTFFTKRNRLPVSARHCCC